MRFIKFIKKYPKIFNIAVISLILAFIIAIINFVLAPTRSDIKKSEEDLRSAIESQDTRVINCIATEEDWYNLDLALDLDKRLKTIELKKDKTSGLFYFKRLIISSFILRVDVKPNFGTSPNLVFYFDSDPLEIKDGSFKLIVGDGSSDVVKFQYFMDGKWHTVKDQDKNTRLSQPIASYENLTMRIETSPDNGYRTTKVKLTYQPGNNLNADKQSEPFSYRFPVKRHPLGFHFAIGLINPKLTHDTFKVEFLNCLFQEIKL